MVGLLIAVAVLSLLFPDFQRGDFSGADAFKDFKALLAAFDDGIQVGKHARVLQTCATSHAHLPLRLHLAPMAPGVHVFRPQPGDWLGRCRVVSLARLAEQGGKDWAGGAFFGTGRIGFGVGGLVARNRC